MNSEQKKQAFETDLRALLKKHDVELEGWDDGAVFVVKPSDLTYTKTTVLDTRGAFDDDK